MQRVIAQLRVRPKFPQFELHLLLARSVGLLGVLNILATLPQVLGVWVDHNTSGVSVVTWAYYAFFSTVLCLYAISIRQWPLIITYLGGSILYYMVLIGTVLFN